MVDVATLALEARTDGLKRAETALNGVTAAAVRTEAATEQVAAAAAQSNAAMAGMSRSASAAGGGFQNLGFQIQDFAVQVGAGTSATQALSQQLPQLLSGFGLLGIAAGTLAAVIIPIAGYFLNAASGADTLNASLERQKEISDALVQATRDLVIERQMLASGASFSEEQEAMNEIVDLQRQRASIQVELNALQYQEGADTDLRIAAKRGELAAERQIIDARIGTLESQLKELDNQRAITKGSEAVRNAAVAYKAIQEQISGIDISGPWVRVMGFIDAAYGKAQAYAQAVNAVGSGRGSGPGGPLVGSADLAAIQAGGGVIRNMPAPSIGGGGGGGGGGGVSDGFQARLDQMMAELQLERDTEAEWYAETMEILNDRRAQEILGAEGHAAALLAVERKLAEDKAAVRDAELGHFEGFLGSMAGALQSGGGKMLAISKGFALAEAAVSIWRGATKALELPFPASLAAWQQVISTGARALSGIKSARFGGGGGVSGGVGAASSTPQQSNRYVRIDVQGDGMFAEQLRANIDTIASAFFDEAKRGGTTVVIGR